MPMTRPGKRTLKLNLWTSRSFADGVETWQRLYLESVRAFLKQQRGQERRRLLQIDHRKCSLVGRGACARGALLPV